MAHPMPVGMLGRLKDQRVAVHERLSLARKLWDTKEEVGPNKQQIIADAVVGVLVNSKKRNELTNEEQLATWEALSHILRTPAVDDMDRNGSVFSVRPLLAQVLVDTLEAFSGSRKEKSKQLDGAVLTAVLECCRAILQSSSLSYVLTTRFDILVSLSSVVCQLSLTLPKTVSAGLDLSGLLSIITSHLQQTSHRCQLSQSQILHILIDKLLQPAVKLVHKRSREEKSLAPIDHSSCAKDLLEFVLKTMFHEAHHKAYKTYLQAVTKQPAAESMEDDGNDEVNKSETSTKKKQEPSQLPRLIESVFSKLFTGFKPASAGNDALLHFLPVFLRHAAHVWRKSSQQTFQLLMHINSYLGFPVDGSDSVVDEGYIQTVAALLRVVHDSNVYNVATDRTGGGGQLKYFRHMLHVLLKAEMSQHLCECLSVLLHLNHVILEPSMKEVLKVCCSQLSQLPDETRSSVDAFLSSLVSTYAQLHQVPKWFDFVLELNAVCPQQLPSVLALPSLGRQLCEVVQAMPQTTALDVWSRLVSEVTSACEKVTQEPDNESSKEKLWSVALLYHEFVNNVRLYESSVTARMIDKIQSLQAAVERNIVSPGVQIIQQKGKNLLVARSCLLLALTLGNVKLMLALYRTSGASQQQFGITSADLPFSLKLYEVLGKKKSLVSDAVVRYLMDSLVAQRIQALEQEESRNSPEQPDLQHLCMLDEMEEDSLKASWNGNVSCVDNENYLLSKLHHVAHKSASVLPIMLEQNGSDLPQLIVEVFTESGHDEEVHSKGHTAISIVKHLMHETSVVDSQEFYQRLVCCLWQRFAQEWKASPKKKKKDGSGTLRLVLQNVGDEGILWTDLSSKGVQSVSGAVSTMLSDDDIQTVRLTRQQKKLVKLFHHLPLAYLPSGSRLQCMLGLLTLLLHQDVSSFSPNQSATVASSAERSDTLLSVTHKEVERTGSMSVMGSAVDGVGEDAGSLEMKARVRKNDMEVRVSAEDDLCCLMTELLDASAGTSVFQVVEPCPLLNRLEAMCSQRQAAEQSPLGLLLKKTVSMVMGDFQSILELEDFVTELKERLQSVAGKLKTGKSSKLNLESGSMLFTVTQYLLQESHWHLRKNFYRQDIQSAARSYFSVISAALDSIVNTLQRLHSEGKRVSLSPPLVRCLEAVTVQRCVDVAVTDEDSALEEKHVKGVEFVLQCVVDELTQATVAPTSASISFLLSAYKHKAQLATLLTLDRTRSVWDTLCSLLLKTHSSKTTDHISSEKDSRDNDLRDSETAVESGKVASKRKRQVDGDDNSSASSSKKVRVTGLDSSEGQWVASDRERRERGGDAEELIRDSLRTVVTACDISLFTELMQAVVSDLSVDNLSHPAVLQEAVWVWQKVIGCNRLTVEQRAALERLSVKYLLQCVDIMRDISCYYQHLSHRVGVPILHSLSQMLTLERFLSSKGTVQCLMCCSLQPLRHSDSQQFLASFHAVCGVLHAALVHHPYTAVKIIHEVMVISSSLLKECIRNGDQSLLLANSSLVDPMVRCASVVSRLLSLLASHRTELQRVAVSIVSDYANGVKAVTLLPAVKKALLPGVYAFLDLCDKHAISQLRTMLPAGVREVFHLLHNDYLKYFKYTGKV